ncbi:short-chain dehydrogenase/reductase-like protein SDR [Xylariaceae sp. FL0016]|nr:short-chain dehydrogenase/reductase-like protein SDR [Xylariaceae sp. FL0016]
MATTLAGKVAILTGAASGIGRATAKRLDSIGVRLVLCDINVDGCQHLLDEMPGKGHIFYAVDVGSSKECQSCIEKVLTEVDHINLLFNCAGINPTALDITDTTDEYFDKLVNTNLRGPYNMIRACVPHLRAGDAIINVASTAGLRATRGFSIYCATKFGVIGFTKAMALELGPKGVRVNCIAPGPIDTPTMAGNVAGGDANEKLVQDIALGRLGQPEEVAQVVVNVFESTFMSGSVVEVHGGTG